MVVVSSGLPKPLGAFFVGRSPLNLSGSLKPGFELGGFLAETLGQT